MKAEDWHKDTGEENTSSIINCRLYRTVKTQKDSKVNRSRDWTKEHKRKTRQRSNHQEMLSRPAFFFSQAGGRKGLYPCQWKTKADFAEGACMLAPSWSQECISEANVLIRLLLLLDTNTLWTTLAIHRVTGSFQLERTPGGLWFNFLLTGESALR